MSPVHPPQVFRYHDYRAFLKDWLADRRAQRANKGSMRKVCRAAGISPALLSLVTSGKRVLTEKMAKKLAPHLELSEAEQSFFVQLVKLSESTNLEERTKAFTRIKRFHAYKEGAKGELDTFKYLNKWYFVAIRELARHPKFQEDPKWIQQQLIHHVPAPEIRKALDFLLEQGFLKRENGRIKQTERDIRCDGGVFQLSLNQFHKTMLELGTESIDNIDKDKRHLSGYTFMIDESSYAEVLKIIEEATKKIQQLEARDSKQPRSPKVFHTEFVTIPLTGEK
ncbi:MAG: TIGR02147 family protein [Bdellovibrionales bacterium]